MIAQTQADIVILSDGEDVNSSMDMSLDSESTHIIMQMLSKNLYSDSIGSTVRETTSNGLDSHRRAGVNDVPIVVSLKRNEEDNYQFCVEDFGTGLDDTDVKNIISKYGKSTKRSSAKELGMFGLGFKSPLAYSNSFYFVCRKNGMERKYMMYEDVDGNKIDLLYENPTTERNGVKVIIPVSFPDRWAFYKKIKEQLCYFESVYFDVNVDNNDIPNDFIIYRGGDFQYSELTTDLNLHICLDNVYYPIDYSKLGITPIRVPVGLRFSLQDGLFPIPNRESLRYTKESIEVIKNKIEKVANYFVEKYNETVTDTDDIKVAYDYYHNNTKIVNMGWKNGLGISGLIPYSTVSVVTPKFKGVEHLNLKNLLTNPDSLFVDYVAKYDYSYGRISENKNSWNKRLQMSDFNDVNYIYEGKFTSLKKSYLRETLKNERRKFIKKDIDLPLLPEKKGASYASGDSYHRLLGLYNIPKDKWRDAIKEYKYIQSLFLSKLINLDTLPIPQTWLDAKKAQGVKIPGAEKRLPKSQGEVIGKIGIPLLRTVDGKSCKLDPITLKLDEISKQPTLYVYGNSDDASMLDKLYCIADQVPNIPVKILVFSERELKIINSLDIHNLIPLSKFMEGNNQIFKRLVTACLINELVTKYQNVFANRSNLLGISQSLHDDLEELLNYRDQNFKYAEDTILQAMKSVSATHNLYDGNMHPEYLRIKDILDTLTFLDPVMRTLSPYLRGSIQGGNEMKGVLCDLFKYYQFKIDFNNYKVKVDDPQEITE